MKNLFIFIFIAMAWFAAPAQPPTPRGGVSYSFIDYQKTFPRPGEALKRKEDTLQKQFEAKKLEWPVSSLLPSQIPQSV